VIALRSAAIVLAVGLLLLGPRVAPPASAGVAALPAVNATLNAATSVLLVTGYVLVRRRRLAAHRAAMTAALVLSTAFLLSYVVYHAVAGSVRFTGQGVIRPVYFTILLSHIVLAAGIVPLVLTTVWRAWSGRFDRHRRIARWTLPLWLYVSVTGVLVYWMLYHLYPPAAP
jgi:putative membrane protein